MNCHSFRSILISDLHFRCMFVFTSLFVQASFSFKMVDRTTYPDDKVPDLILRQVFGRQRLPMALCKLMAETGLVTVEQFSMLGDTVGSVKTTLRAMIANHDDLGTDDPARELALTSLAAVWKTCFNYA